MAGNGDLLPWNREADRKFVESNKSALAKMEERVQKALDAIDDALDDEDPRVRLQAAAMLLDRIVPKVKPKEIETGDGVVVEGRVRRGLREALEDVADGTST